MSRDPCCVVPKGCNSTPEMRRRCSTLLSGPEQLAPSAPRDYNGSGLRPDCEGREVGQTQYIAGS